MSADTLLEVMWPLTGTPLYSGQASTALGVGPKWDVALNGRQYMLDMDPQQQFYGSSFSNASIAALRTQADQGIHPDEATLTRDDFWRRLFESFHHGAGQRWTDRTTSDPFRFNASKGVDVWTRDRLSLLPIAELVAAGNDVRDLSYSLSNPITPYLYWNDGGTFKAVSISNETIGAPFTVTGASGSGTYNTFATDGNNVYALDGSTNNVWKALGGGASVASWATLTAGVPATAIGYAHGRLIVTQLYRFWDVTAGGATAVTASLADINEVYVAIAEGAKCIYLATNNIRGGQSKIYSVTYDPTTATLGAPTVAGDIPAGEIIQSMYGYLSFLFVGTSKGFRMCRQAADGALTIGPLVLIPGGVAAFTGIAQFVYFSWPNFDTSSAGIGRIDISVFTDADLVPAYAADLMAPIAGTTPRVIAFDSTSRATSGFSDSQRPFFAVKGGGIYRQHATNLVASGTLDSGLMGFGFPETKDAAYIDVRHEPLVGSVAAAIASDQAAFSTIDVSNVQGSPGYLMKTGHRQGSRHEVRVTLTQQSATTGPALTSMSLFVYPAIQRGDIWTVPLRIDDEPVLLDDSVGYYDFWAEYSYIKGLAAARAPCTFQVGTQTYTVYVDDYKVGMLRRAQYAPGGWAGTIIAVLKNLERTAGA